MRILNAEIIAENVGFNMKKGDTIYCINESVYSDHLTKRKSYVIADLESEKIRIKNDNGKLVWIPDYCFDALEIPDISSVMIDDEINDNYNDCVEVTIEFSDRERRYATFMTIKWLRGLINEHRNYVEGTGLIFLAELNENIIKQTINDLDKQNKLIEMTIKY